jgi:ABC transporter DrrB family efflux protein|uniref:Transport permease protein n=1 Tax=uncultured bacterium esnapd7 TaxID=1366614 RepID=S5TMC3_9BACT|nr:ABC transporter, permease protein [uncultured bacterium esnapd7]
MVATTAERKTGGTAVQVPGRGLSWWLTGASEMAKRNIRTILRSPQLVMFALIQPVMFILLFSLVFGGAVDVPGGDYTQFLLPGIFVQMVLFGSVASATMGMSMDMQDGIMDRFRSMPISRSSVLVGRTVSEILRTVVSLVVMIVVGTIIGFRFLGGFLPAIGGIALLLFFGYSLSWLGAFIGVTASGPAAAQQIGLIWMFPFSFLSSAFVPTESMPGWLRVYADHTPMTTVVNSLRALFSGTPVGNNVWVTLAWAVGIILVTAPLSVRKYASQSR